MSVHNSEPFNRELFAAPVPPPNPVYVHETDRQRGSGWHKFIGGVTLPAQGEYKKRKRRVRQEFVNRIEELEGRGYKAIRTSVEVNGRLIDVLILGKRRRIENGKWTLYSLPNMESFEHAIQDETYLNRIKKLHSNAVFLNYPGVGCSQGKATQADMIAAYEAVLKMLETRGGTREIVMWGTSIGGGVQGAALQGHEFQEGITYLSVKDQTFASLHKVTDDILEEVAPRADAWIPNFISQIATYGLKKAGWTMDTTASTVELEQKGIHQIIIQSTGELSDGIGSPEQIVGDGVISARRSLAAKILDPLYMQSHDIDTWSTKRFIGVRSEHVVGYDDDEEELILHAIEEELRSSVPYGLRGRIEMMEPSSSSASSSNSGADTSYSLAAPSGASSSSGGSFPSIDDDGGAIGFHQAMEPMSPSSSPTSLTISDEENKAHLTNRPRKSTRKKRPKAHRSRQTKGATKSRRRRSHRPEGAHSKRRTKKPPTSDATSETL